MLEQTSTARAEEALFRFEGIGLVDTIYFLDWSAREEYVYLGYTDDLRRRLKAHEGNGHKFLAAIKGSKDFEGRLHDGLAEHRAAGVKNKSTYAGAHIWKYVEFLVRKGCAAVVPDDVAHMPQLQWDDINPCGQWYLAYDKQVELFPLPERKRIEHAASVSYHMSGSDEWYTPAEIIEAARATMGSIDLDPASCPAANRTVKATHYYSKEVSGLAHPWRGNVWLNPPYADQSRLFVEHLLGELSAKRVKQAVVLLNANSMSSDWFSPLYESARVLMVTRGRLRFSAGSEEQKFSSPSTGSVLLYFASWSMDNTTAFVENFKQFGHVLWPQKESA